MDDFKCFQPPYTFSDFIFLQSMSKEKVLLQPYAEGVLNFVAHIVADSNTILDEVDLCVALVGVLGDLAKLFEHVGPYVMTNHQQVAAFVVKCTTSESEQLRSDAAWAKANLEKQVGTGQVRAGDVIHFFHPLPKP